MAQFYKVELSRVVTPRTVEQEHPEDNPDHRQVQACPVSAQPYSPVVLMGYRLTGWTQSTVLSHRSWEATEVPVSHLRLTLGDDYSNTLPTVPEKAAVTAAWTFRRSSSS